VSPVQGLEQHVFSVDEKREFATNPGALTEYRKTIERGISGRFGIFLEHSTINSETEAHFRQQMTSQLQTPPATPTSSQPGPSAAAASL
jgi:hypothetical protein